MSWYYDVIAVMHDHLWRTYITFDSTSESSYYMALYKFFLLTYLHLQPNAQLCWTWKHGHCATNPIQSSDGQRHDHQWTGNKDSLQSNDCNYVQKLNQWRVTAMRYNKVK
jgi:hypothetical protein